MKTQILFNNARLEFRFATHAKIIMKIVLVFSFCSISFSPEFKLNCCTRGVGHSLLMSKTITLFFVDILFNKSWGEPVFTRLKWNKQDWLGRLCPNLIFLKEDVWLAMMHRIGPVAKKVLQRTEKIVIFFDVRPIPDFIPGKKSNCDRDLVC